MTMNISSMVFIAVGFVLSSFGLALEIFKDNNAIFDIYTKKENIFQMPRIEDSDF